MGRELIGILLLASRGEINEIVVIATTNIAESRIISR